MSQSSNSPPARILPPAGPSSAPSDKVRVKGPASFSSLPFWVGLGLSTGWIGTVVVMIAGGSTHTIGGLSLSEAAIAISAIASPVALIWMVTAYLQRAGDVQSITEPLRRQLTMITGESGAAEARIRRFNQAIREQLELLKDAQNAGQDDLALVLERIKDHRNDIERFERIGVQQVSDIQDIVRRNMEHIEHLMEDKFTMMRVLDERLTHSGDNIGRQVEAVRGQVSEMLDATEVNTQQLGTALERALQDGRKLADVSRAQEASLMAAAESAAETLHGVSGKIDLSIARFLERAGTARGEAEHLASTLDAQARALDEFSNTLPTRVSEAEAALRGVADRLYAGEQKAREQAVNLSEKLAQQVDGLQAFLDHFGDRLGGFDGSLQQRRDDFDRLIARVGEATEGFAQRWERSITDLAGRTDTCLQRFGAVNDDAHKRAGEIGAQMSAAAERYESATERMRLLSSESAVQIKAIGAEVGSQLGQFETLRAALQQVGQEVENRAAAAMQNLQYVLERLLSAREMTQGVGETLVKDLYNAVDQNEQLIGRLNESAQMSVRALGIAAESLSRQEGELSAQTRAAEAMLQEAMTQTQVRAAAAEKGLREQAGGLLVLLAETQDKLGATEQRLQIFGAQSIAPIQTVIQQIDTSADQGLASLTRYGDGLQEQLSRLQQFSTRVGTAGEELGRIVGENVNSIEQLNDRFTVARTVQEDTARHTLDQFAAMADRLQREIAGLGDRTGEAVATLQQASARVSEQSNQLLQDAQSSGSQIQVVTSALQTEAGQIRSILQKQTDELSSDLSRAEKQFLTIGEALKQRTDSAYALLDRVAAHYNEVTRAAAQELENRTQRFEQTATQAHAKADAFGASLVQQIGLIGTGAVQLESQVSQIGNVAGKAMQNLSALNEKLAVTHEAANNNAQQSIARLDECSTGFMRQSNTLSEAAQTAAALIQKAGMTFGEQAGKLLDNSHQTEQHIRGLTATTMALAEQSAQIRAGMEQQNQRLVAQLTDAVVLLDASGGKMGQITSAAAAGADQAAEKLTQATQTASVRLHASQQELQDVASRTETTLAALGSNITQQTTSLSSLNEQLGEQFRSISIANETQRVQLVELFDKLGSAHGQASEVAERTITRLTESLQQIQRQLGALSDQSQSAIGGVRAATSGFADQAGVLIQNAQQAEQQARTVLSVTAALQEQARQLREALHSEGDRTNELLGTLLGKLTAGGGELRDFSSSAELILADLQNGVAQQTTMLNANMQQISERQRSLTVALDAQRDVINGLLNRLALAQDETASTAERAAARLTDSTQQIGRQLGLLDTQSQSTLANIQAASAKFADEAGSLGLHAQQAEQQMRAVLSVTAGMQEQARNLRESMQGETAHVVEQLTGIIAQLEGASGQLKQQSNSAIHVMDQSALQLETITRNSGEHLQKHAEILAGAVGQAGRQMDETDQRLRSHLHLVGEAGEKAEEHGRQISGAIESAVERMSALRGAIKDTDQEGHATLVNAAARIDEVKAALQGDMQRLADASQTAARQVVAATHDLITQSDVLRANLGSSESALAEAARLVREESVQVPAVLDRNTSQIEKATAALKNQAKEADQTLLGTADRFIAVTGAARETMVDEMKQIGRTAFEAEETLTRFNKSLAEQLQSLQSSTGLLTSGQKELVVRAGDSIAQLAAASERLAQLRGEATQSAEKLAREFGNMESRATSASQRFVQTGEIVEKNLELLTRTAERADTQMLAATEGFREQFERIRTGVQGQIDEINRGLMQITAQLERTGTALRSTTAGTVADVEKIASRFDQTSKQAATQLVGKTEHMRTVTEEVATLLAGLGDQIDGLLNRLATAGDGIKRYEGDFVGQMQTALSHLGSVAERLETSRTLAGNVSERAVARLTEVAATVEKQIDNLSSKTETTAGILQNVSRLHGDQANSLNKGLQDAQSQVLSMNKSIEEMQQRADRLRVSLKLQGEELMGSLQQIFDQLSAGGDGLSEAVGQALKEQSGKS